MSKSIESKEVGEYTYELIQREDTKIFIIDRYITKELMGSAELFAEAERIKTFNSDQENDAKQYFSNL